MSSPSQTSAGIRADSVLKQTGVKSYFRTALSVLPLNEASIRKAAILVLKGGVIAYPTDTVYGLGCDPFNKQAVKKLTKAKGREAKPLPILVSSIRNAFRLGIFDERAKILAEKFWPGQLTIVVRKKPTVHRTVTMGRNSVGIRLPDNPKLRKLIERCGGALVGTSANISGRPACKTAKAVASELGAYTDLILDGGRSPSQSGSTVIDLSSPRKVRVLRTGRISEAHIKRVLREGRQKRFEVKV